MSEKQTASEAIGSTMWTLIAIAGVIYIVKMLFDVMNR